MSEFRAELRMTFSKHDWHSRTLLDCSFVGKGYFWNALERKENYIYLPFKLFVEDHDFVKLHGYNVPPSFEQLTVSELIRLLFRFVYSLAKI